MVADAGVPAPKVETSIVIDRLMGPMDLLAACEWAGANAVHGRTELCMTVDSKAVVLIASHPRTTEGK